jgi:hypothetical protein
MPEKSRLPPHGSAGFGSNWRSGPGLCQRRRFQRAGRLPLRMAASCRNPIPEVGICQRRPLPGCPQLPRQAAARGCERRSPSRANRAARPHGCSPIERGVRFSEESAVLSTCFRHRRPALSRCPRGIWLWNWPETLRRANTQRRLDQRTVEIRSRPTIRGQAVSRKNWLRLVLGVLLLGASAVVLEFASSAESVGAFRLW